MRFWNLSSLEKFGTQVVTSQTPFIPSKRMREPGMHMSAPMQLAMKVAALAAVGYCVVTVSGSTHVLTLPNVASVEVTSNVDVGRSPLESLFARRFKDGWTRETEDQLLSEVVKKPAVPDRDFLNLAQTAQHESVSEDAIRLSESDILRITRRKV